GSEGTEEFTKTLNDVFDACNARAKREGIRPLDKKFMTYLFFRLIQNFQSNLCQSDTFASDLTLASIRVTLRSILDVIIYLCNELGFDYVLTGKFNQDCLEKFFGLVRSFGGDNSHPTATSFSHIFRLLSIYCPTSTIIKGNVRTNEETSGAVTSYVETLNELRLTAQEKNKKVRSDLEDLVLEKIMYSENEAQFVNEQFNDNQDHSFVVYKAKSFTKCLKCLDMLEDDNPIGSDMTLTAMKDLGGLKYPCRELFVIIQNMVEPELLNHIQTQHADSDFSTVCHYYLIWLFTMSRLDCGSIQETRTVRN
ncbi:Transposable element P transposase, partial [Orchesella cincta]